MYLMRGTVLSSAVSAVFGVNDNMVLSSDASSRMIESAESVVSSWGNLDLPASKLFGTDGIRGKAGELLTAPLALQIGYWAGQVLSRPSLDQPEASRTIILGQDSRNSSHMLASALSAGLTAAGLEVWNLGLCPTPTVAFLTHSTDAIGGVMISASHNPPEDNGIKFFGAAGTKLSSPLQAAIEAGLRGQAAEAPVCGWGQHYHRPELVQVYAESLYQPLLANVSLAGMKVVLDLAWGAAAEVAPGVFEQLGAKVICLHDYADGDRINVNCGSTHLGR